MTSEKSGFSLPLIIPSPIKIFTGISRPFYPTKPLYTSSPYRQLSLADGNGGGTRTMTEDDRHTEWLAVGPHAWGRGWSKYDAIANMAANIPNRVDGTVSVYVYEVDADAEWAIDNMTGNVRIDGEAVDTFLHADIPMDALADVGELVGDIDIAVESAYWEAGEEIERTNADPEESMWDVRYREGKD